MEINNILKALDNALASKDNDIYFLKIRIEQLEDELEQATDQINALNLLLTPKPVNEREG